jgi:CheY-like chemotaxis protein
MHHMAEPAKILLVDDNPVVLFKVAHLLRSAGYAVLEASTGQDGLRLARAEAPDLALLDVRLPDINGVALCRELKSSPDTHGFCRAVLRQGDLRGLAGGGWRRARTATSRAPSKTANCSRACSCCA